MCLFLFLLFGHNIFYFHTVLGVSDFFNDSIRKSYANIHAPVVGIEPTIADLEAAVIPFH
jgi:hypothetical protein